MMFAQTTVEAAEVRREQPRGGDLGRKRGAPDQECDEPEPGLQGHRRGSSWFTR